MTKNRLSFALALLLISGVAHAAGAEYRLAGIIAPDQGKALALIELPNGEQQLFREGDLLDNGMVAEIRPTGVRIELPNGDLLLELVGTGLVVMDEPGEYRRGEYETTGTHRGPATNLTAISQLAEDSEAEEARDYALKVMNYLKLPADARITAVADQPVASTSEAVKAIAQKIEEQDSEKSGFQFVLSISDAAGNKRIYILRDGEEVSARTTYAN